MHVTMGRGLAQLKSVAQGVVVWLSLHLCVAGEMATNSNNGKQQKKSLPFLLDCYQTPNLFMPCQHCLGFPPEMQPFALVSALTPFAQKQVDAGQYGPGMSELEKQIAEHNILQKEIEAYGLQIKNLRSGVRPPLSSPCSVTALGALLALLSAWLCVPSAPPHSQCPPLFCRRHGGPGRWLLGGF